MDIDLFTQNKEKFYFLGTLGLGIVFAGILILRGIIPGLNDLGSLRKELIEKKTELEQRYNTAQDNKNLAVEIAGVEKEYENLTRMLFPLADTSSAVKEIVNISQDLQIEFTSFDPSAAKLYRSSSEIGFYLWETPISIRMKASYSKLIDFLKRIEKSQKFIQVGGFQIKKIHGNLSILDAQVTLAVYSLQQDRVK